MKIAITGNIGSGKSEVIKYLLKKNYCCISSDKIIAKLHQEENFKNFISSQLHLDKKNYKEQLISNLTNNKFNKQLKKIIYPRLNAEKKRILPKFKTKQFIFHEIPLLFEEKLNSFYDKVIFIKSDCNKRLQRVMQRGVSKDYFYLMNKRQMNQNIKSIQSDFTILNNGSKLDLYNQIQRLIKVCGK